MPSIYFSSTDEREKWKMTLAEDKAEQAAVAAVL